MLIPKHEFIGLDGVTYLATGGESPSLKSHQQAVQRFFADKALGEAGRNKLEETYRRCKEKVARLLSCSADEIAFLSSASEGINLLAHALTWQPGDNVVVGDIEFPSGVLPWTRLRQSGVEVRIVRQRDWRISLDDIAEAIDERTRVVAVSQVSYFTGQRIDLAALSALVRQRQALLLVDATHAAGVVAVEAGLADILVSSAYKWLLGVHGTAVFYWNRARLPDLEPPFLGWHSGTGLPSWQVPTEITLRADADRFVPANPSFISLYILENALDHILKLGIPAIAAHALHLSGLLRAGLQEAGWEVMTPPAAAARAGNICFVAPNVNALTAGLAEQGILVWGGYGGVDRVRVSTHLYNSEADVAHFLATLQ